METLQGKIAIVLGGTGGVGEGIVKSLLFAGATVVVPTRTEYKMRKLKNYIGEELGKNLVVHLGSVNTEENAGELAAFLMKSYKQIDLAVVSLGSWQEGYPLYSYPMHDWSRILQDNLTTHFLAIRTLVPLLNPKESFFFHINHFSAEEGYPLAGPMAMTAAAQKSLIQTLAKEVDKINIKVFELILGPLKTRDRLNQGQDQEDWHYPEDIGNIIRGMTRLDYQQDVVHYLLRK